MTITDTTPTTCPRCGQALVPGYDTRIEAFAWACPRPHTPTPTEDTPAWALLILWAFGLAGLVLGVSLAAWLGWW